MILEPHDTQSFEDAQSVVEELQRQARELVILASQYGITLTIRTQPLKPLAMGNYELVVETSASNVIYRSGND